MANFKKIKTTDLVVGSIFTESIYFDDGENLFLPSGKELKEQDIDVLVKWNISFVLTSPNCIAIPGENFEGYV